LTGVSVARNIGLDMNTHNKKPQSDSRTPVSLTGTIRVEVSDAQFQDPQTKRAFLTVIRGKADLGVHAFIENRTVIGRDPTCEFPLLDHRVSRRHAAIMPASDDTFLVQDLGSTNGTCVDGVLIAGPHHLRDGEKISLGDTVIRFSLADEIDIDFQSEIAMLVGTDPLTGLPSKGRFDEALEFALQSAGRAGRSLAVLMMDMDGVKRINDTHGHLFGAHVIGETGRLIASVLGEKGRACRFGGDEFSAFLTDHDLPAALAIAEQIRSTIETAGMEKDGIPLAPTISIGAACFPSSGNSLLELIDVADKALYRAKGLGKNCVST
jgi:two-component system, cell cycle response regulator